MDFSFSEEKTRTAVGKEMENVALGEMLSSGRLGKEFFFDEEKENVFAQMILIVMKMSDAWKIRENDAVLLGKQTCEMEKKNAFESMILLEPEKLVVSLQQGVNIPWKGKNYCQNDLQDWGNAFVYGNLPKDLSAFLFFLYVFQNPFLYLSLLLVFLQPVLLLYVFLYVFFPRQFLPV